MKLWVDGKKEGDSGSAIRATIKGQVENINRKVMSRGVRAVNELRNAELRVLKGQRNGKVYRVPYTKKATYTASAPGEPPARRTGSLRLHWNGQVISENTSQGGVRVIAEIESQEPYAGYLEKGTEKEDGTPKMAPRPFVDKVKETAMPEIKRIYNESYD